jgi:hypothetical protein
MVGYLINTFVTGFILVNTFMMGFLLVDVATRRFPDWFEEITLNMSFKCIHIYSKVQLLTIKIKNKCNQFINNNVTLTIMKDVILNYANDNENDNENDYIIETYKDGKLHQGIVDNNDFIINSNVNVVNEGCVLKKIRTIDNHINYIFEKINYHPFLLIEFKVGENENAYKIDLKTDKYDYYVVDNHFTKDFFIYYIKHHLQNISESIKDTDQYSIKIIDSDVKTIEFKFTDKKESIVLGKEGYKIYL